MIRCKEGFLAGLCTVPDCPHFDGQVLNQKNLSTLSRRGSGKGDRKRVPGRQVGFVDMTGEQWGSWKVIAEVASENGCTRWRAEHACGAVQILDGTRLRSDPPRYCDACRPKRAGTVQRKQFAKGISS